MSTINKKLESTQLDPNINIMENLAIIPSSGTIDKGFYVPVFATTEDMKAFTPPRDGVIIFNSETKSFMTFSEGEWVNFNNTMVIPVASSDPVNPQIGQVYLNSTKNIWRIFTPYMGGRWGGTGIALDID